jgi:hypothetical protein
MKKLILFVVVLISLSSCSQRLNLAEVQPMKQTNPSQYFSTKTNDLGRILRALKLDPSDVYASYASFVSMR